MKKLRSFAGVSVVLLSVACESRSHTATIDASPPRTDASPSDVSVADVALEPLPDVSETFPQDASVRARPVVRASNASERWVSRAALARLGDRSGLDAHLRRVAARAAELREELLQRERALQSGSITPSLAQTAGVSSESSAVRAERPAQRAAGSDGANRAAAAANNSNARSITNNQVASVDEGDIVKAAGDDLIILRRGHLFRVTTANNTVRRVGHAPAFAPDARPGDWYDELLVDGDIALVLGYSYEAQATEVNRFRLEAGGAIRYLDSFYLRSDDYYSSENYATRLVNGQFVMYVPVSVANAGGGAPLKMPALRNGKRGEFRPILEVGDVFASRDDRESTTVHAVLRCDVHAPTVSCRARGVLGGASRTFYVSSTATYVWTAADSSYGYRFGASQAGASWIVRMPHADSEAAGAVQIQGGPADQFAFDERNGALHLLLRTQGAGDGMWSRYGAAGGVAALAVPLSRLTDAVVVAPEQAYTMLVPSLAGGEFEERWVGDFALFSSRPYHRYYRHRGQLPNDMQARTVFAYRASDQRLFELRSEQDVDRIEPLGAHALIVGNAGGTMILTPIALDGASPEPYASARIEGRREGESRSHGFFFNPTGARSGVFGLATTQPADEGPGSSDVSFFRVEQLALSTLGTVSARPRRDNRCSTSCYDWYGNTRPIFWGDRVFALMGDEVVETVLAARSLSERRRVDYGLGVRGVVESEDE